MKVLIVFALAVANLDFVVQSLSIKSRIINGHAAAEGAAPYIVSLKKGSHFCAGSIIDEHWVVTAAHCMVYEDFEVVAGLHDRNNENNVQIRKVPNTSVQFIHEKYTGAVKPYDIALIYIAEAFDLDEDSSTTVAEIDLPFDNYEQTGKATLFGWGRVNTGDIPNILQTLDVDVISYDECKAALPFELGERLDSNSNICSFTANRADGACNGDSGGPLVRYTPEGVELLGIVSWGYTPCTTYYPSVYTMVSSFNDWIVKIITNFNYNHSL